MIGPPAHPAHHEKGGAAPTLTGHRVIGASFRAPTRCRPEAGAPSRPRAFSGRGSLTGGLRLLGYVPRGAASRNREARRLAPLRGTVPV